MTIGPDSERVLGHKAYLRIPHLPGSRTGSRDRVLPRELARRLTHQCKPGDTVVVQEKLDGSCVAVTKRAGEVIALGREGFRAAESQNPGRQLFARWVAREAARFADVLREGEWLVGEWLALAHSTRYQLTHEPFVVFDLSFLDARGALASLAHADAETRLGGHFARPAVLHAGHSALSVEAADALLGAHGRHGAVERVEGAVWRLERDGRVLQRAKFVRPGKVDGALLPENSGQPAVWNWTW